MNTLFRAGDGLLLVDVQVDFCPGGALPIPRGDEIVPVLNRWIDAAREANIPIYASRDWHPLGHPSFESVGGVWPEHCLQDSAGAAFHPRLALPNETIIVTKGTRFDKDQYSAFSETGLSRRLDRDGVKRVWLCGLALDVCVRASALDARRHGFAVALDPIGSRAVEPSRTDAVMDELERAGVVVERTEAA